MNATAILMSAALLSQIGLPSDRSTSSRQDAVLSGCLVNLIDEVQLPAEEAGVLASIDIEEGDEVRRGDIVARIDDREGQMQKKAAEIEYIQAQFQAKSDIYIRAAQGQAAVDEANHAEVVAANAKAYGAVTRMHIRTLKLKHENSLLQIEKSETEHEVAGLTAEIKSTAVEMANERIRKMKLDAPLDGVVVKLYRHAGEWVQPGDPVMRIVRMDRLRVEGFLNVADFAPQEIVGRPVSATVNIKGGHGEPFRGEINFVSPLVEANGEYRVRAELKNYKVDGQWVLRPGLTAEMTIQVQ